MNKHQQLSEFIATYKHLPEQGTDAWKRQRLNFIGGSEVATILKRNKHKSVNKLIMEKLGFDPFTGSAVTYWGNVFEELIRLHTEEKFSCAIREIGSIPYQDGYLPYSPDGLSVVNSNALSKFAPLPSTHNEHLTLFEFKCPHSRVPTHEVPEHYLPQITIGMNIIDIMEVGVFIQAVYRRCRFTDIKYNKAYNNIGHFKSVITNENPIETGFMVLYSDDEEYVAAMIDHLDGCSGTQSVDGIIDAGSIIDKDAFEDLMRDCVSKQISIDYSYREPFVSEIFSVDGMTQACYNISLQYRAKKRLELAFQRYRSKIIAILPFKLLDLYITPVVKQHDFIQESNAWNKAKQVIECIDKHRGCDNKQDVAKAVRACKL